MCNVQEPPWRRYGIGPNYVKPICRYLSEISLNNFRAVVLRAIVTGPKRTISDAADVQLLLTGKKELAPHARPDTPHESS
jgi:hypothetical protein